MRPPCGRLLLIFLADELREFVVDVLHLAGEAVWLVDASDAEDELADLPAVGTDSAKRCETITNVP